MQRARRINRIESPMIDVTFRGEVNLTQLDVWREDRLTYGEATYLVLDFGLEEVLTLRLDEDENESDQSWVPSGALVVEIQRIDPATGEGLANPSYKEISGGDGGPITWTNWQLVPCSPRRQAADAPSLEPIAVDSPVDEAAKVPCVICGAPSVHCDAVGEGHCAAHVGESPEEAVQP